jgi:hypothetical protein
MHDGAAGGGKRMTVPPAAANAARLVSSKIGDGVHVLRDRQAPERRHHDVSARSHTHSLLQGSVAVTVYLARLPWRPRMRPGRRAGDGIWSAH